MEEKEGNPKCIHDWVYDSMVIVTNPPIYHKICKKCGRIEHEQEEYIEINESFSTLNEKFHKAGQT